MKRSKVLIFSTIALSLLCAAHSDEKIIEDTSEQLIGTTTLENSFEATDGHSEAVNFFTNVDALSNSWSITTTNPSSAENFQLASAIPAIPELDTYLMIAIGLLGIAAAR